MGDLIRKSALKDITVEGMTFEEALHDLEDCVLPAVGGKSIRLAIEVFKAIDSIPTVDPLEAPTKKQVSFAKEIAEELDIPLPDRYTKNAYRVFISSNINRYNTSKSTRSVTDEEFSAYGGIGIGNEHFL